MDSMLYTVKVAALQLQYNYHWNVCRECGFKCEDDEVHAGKW